MGAFSGFAVGSRLILTRQAGELEEGTEVEVVEMLGPGNTPAAPHIDQEDDGIRVQQVVDGKPGGKCFEFAWECGARYFK